MTQNFIYSFAPRSEDPARGAAIELDVCEITDAGIRGVLQTPDAAYDSPSIILRAVAEKKPALGQTVGGGGRHAKKARDICRTAISQRVCPV